MPARSHRGLLPLAAIALALSIDARVGAAEPAPEARAWTVAWSAPAECPTKESLDARLAELLATSHPTQTMSARVDVERVRGAYRAHLHTYVAEARGERTLAAPTCDLVTSAAALVLAITLDPDLRIPPSAPPTPGPTPPPPPPRVEPEPLAPPPAPPPAPSRWSLTLAPRIGVDQGTLPSLTAGGGVTLGARHGAAAVEAYGEAWLAAHAASEALAGAGGTFTLLDTGLRGCLRSRGELRVGGCAGAEVDRMHGVGFGVTSPSSANRTWISPRVGAEVAWIPLAPLEVPVTTDLLAPLSRPTFALRNAGTVFVPSAVAVRVSVGVTIHFW